eukprot:2861777-Rhodomonas_salina.1
MLTLTSRSRSPALRAIRMPRASRAQCLAGHVLSLPVSLRLSASPPRLPLRRGATSPSLAPSPTQRAPRPAALSRRSRALLTPLRSAPAYFATASRRHGP